LPPHRFEDGIALVHATPGNYWKAPKDEELLALNASIAVFGHTHVPFVRRVGERVIANSGSVGLPYDNDPRAAYLLIDGSDVQVRRVAYDVNRESRLLRESGMPHAEWVAAMLARGAFQMP
jgi:predicted phosphodiesterase